MSMATMAFGMVFLIWILVVLFSKGIGAMAPSLFLQTTPPPGSAGGLANAIAGSVHDGRRRDAHRDADRYPGGHLPRRVRYAAA